MTLTREPGLFSVKVRIGPKPFSRCGDDILDRTGRCVTQGTMGAVRQGRGYRKGVEPLHLQRGASHSSFRVKEGATPTVKPPAESVEAEACSCGPELLPRVSHAPDTGCVPVYSATASARAATPSHTIISRADSPSGERGLLGRRRTDDKRTLRETGQISPGDGPSVCY